MKNLVLLILLFISSNFVHSQCDFDINVLSTNNVSCNGQCNGSVTVEATGGTGPYLYTWDDPSNQTTATAVGLCAGLYVVTVYDQGALCSEILTVQITEPAVLFGAAASIPATCNGQNDGIIIFTATGGTMPYSYSTDGGVTFNSNPTIPGYAAGVYSYVIQDANGCVTNGLVTVTEPTAISSFPNTQPAICGGFGGVQISAGGGTSPYVYSVGGFTNTTGSFFNMLAPGNYIYTVVDANGCLHSNNLTITSINNPLTLITTQSQPSCGACDGMVAVAPTSGTGPFTFAWNTGATTQTIASLCAGTYSVFVTDANGCVGNTSVTLNSASSLFNNPMVQNTDCGACNGSVTAFATGGTPPYEYSFDGGATFSTLDNAQGLCAGPVVVVVTDVNNCSNIVTVVVSTDPIPGLTVTSVTSNESGFSLADGFIDLTLNGTSGPYTFLWNNGATTEDIYSLTAGTYTVTITDNNGNCTEYSFVIGTTPAYGYITGYIYNDVNGNCVFDAGDVAISNYYVTATDGTNNYFSITNSQGYYSIWVPSNSYTVTPNTSTNLSSGCTNSYSVTVTNGSIISNNNFAYTFPPVYDVCINTWSSGIVPGFNGSYYIYVSNPGTMPADGDVCITLPSPLTFISSTPTATTVTSNVICMPFTALAPGSTLLMTVTFNAPVSLVLGTPLVACLEASVTNGVDVNPACNYYCYTRIVTGSFDPNDKTVSPAGENPTGDIYVIEEEFNYLIRFQNTGTGPAHNVVITDTLSALLDMMSLEVLNASHDYIVELLPNDIIRFRFDNIMLPDSGSNEPASHGHVYFRINIASTPIVGQVINNTANIYFDFNEPIITNTTVNTYIMDPDGINDITKNEKVILYPNPSDGLINVVYPNVQNTTSQIEIFDLTGRIILNTSMLTQKTIDLSSYGKGMYWLRISNENGIQTVPVVIR